MTVLIGVFVLVLIVPTFRNINTFLARFILNSCSLEFEWGPCADRLWTEHAAADK
jgi:hypothetical protein